jgi:hypothetical protein
MEIKSSTIRRRARDWIRVTRRLVPLVWVLSTVILLACARKEEAVQDTGPAVTQTVASQSFGTLRKVINEERAETTGVARGVRLVREGKEVTPEIGMELLEGDAVTTEGQTRAVLESSMGSEFFIGPDGEVTLGKGSVFLKRERLFSKLKGPFGLETKYVRAGIEGTEVDLSVASDDVVSLSVLEGTVRVTSKTERWSPRLYGEGEHGVVRGEAEPTKSLLDPSERESIQQWVKEFEPSTGAGVAR